MASVLSAIEAQLITDLKTTAITDAFSDLSTETTKEPAAWFIIGGGDIDAGSYNVLDVTHDMQVWIEDGTRDDVNALVEAVIALWQNLTKHNALRALGVLDILSEEYTYAVETGSGNRYQAIISFVITIRHTY